MPRSLDTTLKSEGLNVSEHAASSGEMVYKVSGKTFTHRKLFRELGGQWNGLEEVWVFSGADPREAFIDALGCGGATRGLSDAQPAGLVLPNEPHYWGHRKRLRDRLLAGDEDALPDYELLELLLFYWNKRADTKPLAKQLLDRFDQSLPRVLNARAEQLEGFENIDRRALALFKAVRLLAARMVKEEMSELPVLDTWDKLIEYLRASMAHRMVEQFRVLFLDRMNVLIGDEVQHEGTIDHTAAYPREVVKQALKLDASAIVVVHNHPSNHPKPSKADIAMTQDIRDAVEKVGVMLHDHLIISRSGHTSFRQMGLL